MARLHGVCGVRGVVGAVVWLAALSFGQGIDVVGPRPPMPGARRNWGPEQATGAPDTLEGGDRPTAWAARMPDSGPEWLQLDYDREVTIGEVRIRETCGAGAITKVTALLKDNKEVGLWEGREPPMPTPGVFAVTVDKERNVPAKSVIVYFDTTLVPGWNQIDAVQLVARDGPEQWASRATASSTYAAQGVPQASVPPTAGGKRPWGPEQATGEPDTFEAGHIPTAWAPLSRDRGAKWLQVEFPNEASAAEIAIRETCGPGTVVKVTATLKDGTEEALWEGREPGHDLPGSFVVFVPKDKEVVTRSVKIYLDSGLVAGWNEIDAVRLVAKDGTGQWASKATASSSFADRGRVLPYGGMGGVGVDPFGRPMRGYAPEQATGEPNTLEAGDRPTAWASRMPNGGPEWLKLGFGKEADVAEVRIRETNAPGAITKVSAFGKDGKEQVLWQGREPDHEFPGDFVVAVDKEKPITSKSVKVYLDTALVGGWNEIDAVRLVARDGTGQWAETATASSSYGQPGPVAVYDRFADPDGFNELGEVPVKVRLEGGQTVEGTFLRSRGEFIAIRQEDPRRTLLINKRKIVFVEVAEPPAP